MYTVVRNYPGEPELVDALVEHQSDVKSLISGIDGFRAYYLARTVDGGMSISVFDTEAGAEESTRAAGEWLRENLPGLSINPPDVFHGEVVIDF